MNLEAVPHISDCIISIGSNVEPEMNISKAVTEISRTCEVVGQSKREWIKVIGTVDQADFLNGAIHIRTHLTKGQMHEWLRQLEHQLGRIRAEDKPGLRTIDLDIVIWNRQVVDPDVYRREFLKQAVQELWPGLP
jgi:2-amino-4-hydroxy-6-hydroxymethyldihydropteridine diphosphokinase